MTATIVIPSNPTDIKSIYDAIKEADASMMRIAAEQDQIKAIIDDVSEKFEIDKKYIRRLITTYNKQNLELQRVENDDFITLYETIVK